ncbi:MAG TPA: peroxiredoxin [Acidimicrobiales bacterium]|nr:peroxiredoxin [Acidimicrobiales bacterium]
MSLRINSPAPNFEADTTHGWVNFHEWLGGSWGMLFSHPKDFTPVCTTELARLAVLEPEFAARGTKVIGLSVDPVGRHKEWEHDIESAFGHSVHYPIIADPDLVVATLYGMLPEGANDPRHPADSITVRSVFLISPDKRVRASLSYPNETGRNFDEILRLLQACQLTAKFQVATPVDWHPGGEVIIPTTVTDSEAKLRFPEGWEAPLPYLRLVADPQTAK